MRLYEIQVFIAEMLLSGEGDTLFALQSLCGSVGMVAFTFFLPYIFYMALHENLSITSSPSNKMLGPTGSSSYNNGNSGGASAPVDYGSTALHSTGQRNSMGVDRSGSAAVAIPTRVLKETHVTLSASSEELAAQRLIPAQDTLPREAPVAWTVDKGEAAATVVDTRNENANGEAGNGVYDLASAVLQQQQQLGSASNGNGEYDDANVLNNSSASELALLVGQNSHHNQHQQGRGNTGNNEEDRNTIDYDDAMLVTAALGDSE